MNRQPGKRYPSRRWTCPYQCHRTVWTDSRYKTLPHSARSTVRQGHDYLCRFYVFRCGNGLRVTNSFGVGKQQARPEIPHQIRGRKRDGSRRRCCSRGLWPQFPLRSIIDGHTFHSRPRTKGLLLETLAK